MKCVDHGGNIRAGQNNGNNFPHFFFFFLGNENLGFWGWGRIFNFSFGQSGRGGKISVLSGGIFWGVNLNEKCKQLINTNFVKNLPIIRKALLIEKHF